MTDARNDRGLFRTAWRAIAGAACVSALLVACGPVQNGRDTSALPGVGALDDDLVLGADAPTRPTLTPTPEILQLSGSAKWNGNRTVPGLWVAHPRAVKSMDVQVLHSTSGRKIQARLFRSEARADGDEITLSSKAAKALGLEPGRRAKLTIVALAPGNLVQRRDRKTAEQTARSALTGFAATLDHDRLAQLVGALLRGMGYQTKFTDGAVSNDGGTGIRATPGFGPALSVAVRSGGSPVFSGGELGTFGSAIGGRGKVGLVVSVPGFSPDIRQARLIGGAFVETLDLAGLLDLWVERYQDIAPQDRALLPLKPVYFLAGN